MSTVVGIEGDRTVTGWTRLADYIELTKPRILSMVLVTVGLTSLIATWGQPDLVRVLHTFIGTTLVAASASIFNHWIERRADALMRRTENRPVAAGRLGHGETLATGTAFVFIGLAYLLNTTGSAPTLLAAATWILYVCVYTPLKQLTWLNTLVGAVPGALPVLIGWTGTGQSLDMRAWSLFALVFLWQFPHFMAIAWLYRHQYSAAGMRMLTVVDPSGRRAGRQAISAAISVLIVSLVPAGLMMWTSWTYIVATSLLGCGQLWRSYQFAKSPTDQTARRLLRASLIYLPSQFALITLLTLAII